MWTSEADEVTVADPHAVWRRWADPSCWHEHDPSVGSASLLGPVAKGTKIEVVPKNGPKSTMEIVDLEPGRLFATSTGLPGCTLRVVQTVDSSASDEKTRFSHRMELSGLSAPIFRRLFVERMATDVPQVLRNIARLAEGDRS